MPASAPATLLIQTAFIGDVILATALVETSCGHVKEVMGALAKRSAALAA